MYVGQSTTTTYQQINFPSGRFTQAPIVVVSQVAGNDNFYNASGNAITTSGFTMNASKNGPGGQDYIQVNWIAYQWDELYSDG